jgi:hypothetical protein
MVHYAKVDWWLAALVGGAAAAEIAAGSGVVAMSVTTGEPDLPNALGIGGLMVGVGVLLGLLLWGCYKIRYEITSSELVVRFGPFRSTLPLAAIVEVFPTCNPLGAPAPSLDRLRINYRRKNGKMWFGLISPKDKEAFVRDLAKAAPQLRSTSDGPLRLKVEAPA